MMRQRSLVFLASAFGLLGTNAWADGMVQPRPRHDCEAARFAGSYIGAAVGYGSRKVEVDNLTLGTSFSDEEGAFTVGGYAGYNWQHCGSPHVLGIEADFNYLGGDPTALDIEFGPTGLNETTRLNSGMDWFGTLRARAGSVVHNHILLYATGGLAYARVDHTLSDNCVGCGNTPFNLGPFSQSNDTTRVGWTVGGGGEFLHDSHWLIRGEALFVDLGSDTNSYVIDTPLATANALAKWDDQFWIARIGAAYKFDWP